MAITQAERFALLQSAAHSKTEIADDYRRELNRRYQAYNYAPSAKRRKLEAMENAARKAADKFYAFLATITPDGRKWDSGVPCSYLLKGLTYADATTRGQLAVVPPPAYGYTDQDMRVFSWAIRDQGFGAFSS